jgi:hypothetical protein
MEVDPERLILIARGAGTAPSASMNDRPSKRAKDIVEERQIKRLFPPPPPEPPKLTYESVFPDMVEITRDYVRANAQFQDDADLMRTTLEIVRRFQAKQLTSVVTGRPVWARESVWDFAASVWELFEQLGCDKSQNKWHLIAANERTPLFLLNLVFESIGCRGKWNVGLAECARLLDEVAEKLQSAINRST